MTDLLSLYRTMVRIRAFEDAAEAASQGGVSWGGAATGGGEVRVKGPLHLSTGQEAVAAGVCAHLKPADLQWFRQRNQIRFKRNIQSQALNILLQIAMQNVAPYIGLS